MVSLKIILYIPKNIPPITRKGTKIELIAIIPLISYKNTIRHKIAIIKIPTIGAISNCCLNNAPVPANIVQKLININK